MTKTTQHRFSLSTYLILSFICSISSLFAPKDAHAAFGDILAQYTFPASSLVMSPTEPLMYATIPSQNSVAIINTNTLAVETTVFVGSGPANLAFSPDGLKAYIANSTSNFVAVFDTQTRTVIDSFLIPEHPQDVVFGSFNRLWVLGQNHIFQIDATTGNSTGPSIGYPPYIYSGSLEISPDRNTLYYADYGLCGGTIYKIDVSGTNPVVLLQTSSGCNGEDLTLSHNGNFLCFTTGAGQNNYDIAKYRTLDFATVGSFYTGPYPQALAFGPDDSVVYASVHTAGGIKVFNANAFLLLGTITGPEVASKLAVDSTGRDLFAGYATYYGFMGTIVFDVSSSPTPTPTASPTPTATATATVRPSPTPTPTPTATPGSYSPFFNGQVYLGGGWYWLQFPSSGNCFGYYNMYYFPWVYHQDMGWEYFLDANNGGGAYLYDSSSGHWWYTSPTFAFPYLYDFNLQAVLYYLPTGSCRYSSNPRWFYNLQTHQWINL